MLQDFGHVLYGVRNAVQQRSDTNHHSEPSWSRCRASDAAAVAQDLLEFCHEDFPRELLMAVPKRKPPPPKTPKVQPRGGEGEEHGGEDAEHQVDAPAFLREVSADQSHRSL